MLLKRFYDDKLAQASYLLGCPATGEALVIDANRDTEQYIRAAAADALSITHVTETHIHADYVSGSRELAARTGAKLLLSDEGDANWKYAFVKEDGAIPLHDGDHFMIGNVKVGVLHTPGHTPEHISFVITDTPAIDQPIGVFTGDFVFAGDVGRPDLLERAAKVEGTMEASARALFRSLQSFKQLPDYLQLWPGHGAGSACGKSLGAIPSTTLGYEKIANWGLQIADEEAFVEAVLAGQPEPPRYFAEMKRINRDGPRILHGARHPERLPATALERISAAGHMIVDTRPPGDFAAGYVMGTINIPLNRSFTTWAGWLLSYEQPFYLIVEDEHCSHCVDEAVRDLAMIGLDRVAGYFGAEAVEEWAGTRDLEQVPQVTAAQLARDINLGTVAVIDVRGRSEWQLGHLPGAINIPVGYLLERADDIPRDVPVVVQCQSGARSAIAASVLRAAGLRNVSNLVGGYAAWRHAGLPAEEPRTRVLTTAR